MTEVEYAVIILNYNTIEDAVNAAKSVIEKASTEDFVVCIVDNASPKETDRTALTEIKLKNTITYQLENNNGYANGNNEGIHFTLKEYRPRYIVIMNPDVLILETGTIEQMILKIDAEGSSVVGGQPLVWNCYYGDDAKVQQNIRRVPEYKDLCIVTLKPLRLIYRKRYRKYTYAEQKPYKEHIRYHVPSGAFFIIQTDIFKQVGYFDNGTFLYYEEHILGYKLRNIEKQLLFMPEYKVRHEHGKSTGATRFKFNRRVSENGFKSCLYYAEKYLEINKAQRCFLILLHRIDNVCMSIIRR